MASIQPIPSSSDTYTVDNINKLLADIQLIDTEIIENTTLTNEQIDQLTELQDSLVKKLSLLQINDDLNKYDGYNLKPENFRSNSPINLTRKQEMQICLLFTPEKWNSMIEYDRYCTYQRTIGPPYLTR